MFSNKALKKLIIPLFLDQILIITVSIIGTMMISYAGEAAVSGVSLVDMINMLLINVLAALATGGAVVVSQYIGRKEKDQASFAASQLVTITTVISTGIMLFVLLFNKLALRILFGSVDEEVMTAAIIYFIISGLSYPFLAVYNSCAALFRSMGNSRIPMIISIVMNVTNVALNAIGIFVFHAGVMGIALATLIARGIAAVIIMYLSLNKNNEIFICFSEIFSWQGSMIKRILKIAIPNGLENGTVQLGRVLLVSIIALFGTAQIAANGITNSLVGIAISFAIFLWSVSFTLPNGLRAAGDVRFTMIVSIGSMFILRIALGYILAIVFKMGVIGIWVAMGFDWMIRSVIYIVRFKSGRWKEFQVI